MGFVGQHVAELYMKTQVVVAMPFTFVGVLASLTTPVARAGLGIFAVLTFSTAYLLVKAKRFPEAVAALRAAWHVLERTDA